MKKVFLFLLLFCASAVIYAQQQIPKIGIIDYSRIVQRMMPNSDQLQDIKNIKQAIEDEFGVDIPDEEAQKIKTIGDIVQYVEDHQE